MHLLTAELFFVLVVLDNIQSIQHYGKNNVCFTTETFTERTYSVTKVPITLKKKTRCWNLFKLFSCEKTEVIWEERQQPRVVTKIKSVPRCCLGYREEENKCVPICRSGCENGKCIYPEFCSCDTGYSGARCEIECPEGSWGQSCINKCNCSENARCDNIFGCVCQPGWEGNMCESSCKDGYYGHLCKEKCNCNYQSCNHKTGECKTTAETQTTTMQPQFFTSTMEVKSTQLITNTDDTVEWSDIKDKTTTPETSTEDFFEGNFVEVHLNIEKSTTARKISEPENLEISHITADSTITTDVRATEDETTTATIILELIRSDEKEEVTIPSVTGVKKFVSTKPSLNVTTKINVDNVSKESIFNKTKPKVNWVENEVSSDVYLQVITENPDQIQTKTIHNIAEPEIFDEGKNNIKKTYLNLISTVQVDKNESESLIFKENGGSSQEILFKWLHFLPTLSVLPAVSFLIIIIITATWVLVKHRRKAKMTVMLSEKKRVLQFEERTKFQVDFFRVNNCTVNPVYLSDVDLNNTPPVLETFKPLNNNKKYYATAEKTNDS